MCILLRRVPHAIDLFECKLEKPVTSDHTAAQNQIFEKELENVHESRQFRTSSLPQT